jgi:hypothetical protein
MQAIPFPYDMRVCVCLCGERERELRRSRNELCAVCVLMHRNQLQPSLTLSQIGACGFFHSTTTTTTLSLPHLAAAVVVDI